MGGSLISKIAEHWNWNCVLLVVPVVPLENSLCSEVVFFQRWTRSENQILR